MLIAAAFTGWATWDTVTTLAALDDPALPVVPVEAMNTTGAEPFHAAGIALVSLSIILVTLVSFHRRIVREGASQA